MHDGGSLLENGSERLDYTQCIILSVMTTVFEHWIASLSHPSQSSIRSGGTGATSTLDAQCTDTATVIDWMDWVGCRGEFVMLRGPSGGGKTTLLNILGAIDRSSSGQVGMNHMVEAKNERVRVISDRAMNRIDAEILGDTIDESSADEYLANLRLSRIGICLPGSPVLERSNTWLVD
jgi:hypothetical protein